MNDTFGQALIDYQMQKDWEDLTTISSVTGRESLPVRHLFRDFKDMPALEHVLVLRYKP